MKRIAIRVEPRGPSWLRTWTVEVGGLALPMPTRAEAMRWATDLAKRHAAGGGEVEVVVRRVNGTIGERNTYPRSSDPRRTPG